MTSVKDSDTSLWLYNKLGTSTETWVGGSICSQLNVEVLRNIQECFADLQTHVKLKLLLGFLHFPRKRIEEWRTELEGVLDLATRDSDQWVSMLAEMMRTFPATGSLNTDIHEVEENRKFFTDLVGDLKELMRNSVDMDLLPLECHYLNRTTFGQSMQPPRHFLLRHRPRSASLRGDLLRRAEEATTQLAARHTATGPLRAPAAPRRPDSAVPAVSGAGLPRGLSARPALSSDRRRPLPSQHQARSVKMLDIAEQPSNPQHGKRRRKTPARAEGHSAERVCEAGPARDGGPPRLEPAAPVEREPPRQPAPVTAATPDYAAGLLATALAPPQAPIPASAPPLPPCSHNTVSALASLGAAQNAPAADPGLSREPRRPGPTMYAPQPPVRPVTSPDTHTADWSQPQSQLLPRSVATTHSGGELPLPGASLSQLPQPPQTVPGGRPPLTLTREQMLEAQEMFRTANKVTRPEKALILGFIAGSRDNPCPHLGDVITIKLSESAERLTAADAAPDAVVLAETHFQMNYSTGEWKRVKKFRRLDHIVG